MQFPQHESARSNADVEVAGIYSEDVAKIIHEGSYPKQQVFQYRQRASCWKKRPPKVFIAREKPMPGFKDQAGSLVGV